MDVVPHRQIASPDDAAVALAGGSGQIEVVGVDENRIAEIQKSPRHVPEPERRVRLRERQLSDANEATNCVRIGDACETEIRLRLTPTPRPREPFARSSDLVVGPCQLVTNSAVAPGAPQRIRWTPRQRQQKCGIMDDGRIDDDVLTEAALIALLLLDARRKYAPEIPVAICVLSEVHERMLSLEVAQQNPTIEQVARVVGDRDRPGSKEDGILIVPDFHRVYRDSADEPAAHVPDVDFAFYSPFQHRRHHAAQSLLPDAGMSDAKEAKKDNRQQSQQDD